jgi:hypothetical protein
MLGVLGSSFGNTSFTILEYIELVAGRIARGMQ